MHLALELDDFKALTIRRTGGAGLTTDVLQALRAIENVRLASHASSGNIVQVVWPSLRPVQDIEAIRGTVYEIYKTLIDMGHQVDLSRRCLDVDELLA